MPSRKIQECYWISEEEWQEAQRWRKLNQTRIKQIRTALFSGSFQDNQEIAEAFSTDTDVVLWISTHPEASMEELKMVFGEKI